MVVNVAGALAAYQQSSEGALVGGKKKTEGTGEAGGMGSFSDTLQTFIGDGVKAIKEGEKAAAAGAAGKANLQEVVLAVGNAEMMMQTVTAIRDKVIGAYQDIIRMPI